MAVAFQRVRPYIVQPLTPWPSVNTSIAARVLDARAAPVLRLNTTPAPVAAAPVSVVPALDLNGCAQRGGCSQSPAVAVVTQEPDPPALSLAKVESSQLAGDSPADPKAVGAALQKNGGLLLWLVIALIVVAVMSGHGGGGRRSSW